MKVDRSKSKEKQEIARRLLQEGKPIKEIHEVLVKKFGNGISKTLYYQMRKELKLPKGLVKKEPEVVVFRHHHIGEPVKELAKFAVKVLQASGISSISIGANGKVKVTKVSKDFFQV